MIDYAGTELGLFEQARVWKRYWSRCLQPYLGTNVLEVGAGIGANIPHLITDRQRKWLSIEPDDALREQISRKISAGRLPTRVRAATATVGSLAADQRFDTILYLDVIEHIQDDAEEFARAVQHLESEGHLIVLAPAHQFLFSPFDTAIGHFKRYDRKSLRSLGSAAAVEEVAMFYLDSVGLAASFANKLILKAAEPTAAQIRLWDSVMVRLSLVVDPLTLRSFGKSIVGVWRRK